MRRRPGVLHQPAEAGQRAGLQVAADGGDRTPRLSLRRRIHHTDTPACDTGPETSLPDQWSEPVAEPIHAVETESVGVEFASDVVRCMVRLSQEGPPAGSLGVPFGLTAWMVRHGASVDDAIDAVLRLRS